MLTVTLDPQIVEMAGGDKYVFAAPAGPIRFGRSMESEIRFSPSDARLGRNHFELRPAAGSYELVTDRVHPVFMNGERVVGNFALLENTELRLVDATNGPWIRIFISQSADGNITDPNFKTDSGTVQQGMKQATRLVAGVAALALMIGGFSVYQWRNQALINQAYMKETGALVEKLTTIRNAEPSADWKKIGAAIMGSVYQVSLKSNDGSRPTPMGTAWVSGDSQLTTNGHVAALFEKAKTNNQTLVISSPDQPDNFIPIVSVKIHPAYLNFQKALIETGAKLNAMGSYDVANLIVDTATKLAPKLNIASADDLQNLKPGEAIAYVGYPVEDAKNKAAEQMHIGIISGSTDFLGVGGNQSGQLIYHTASASGGASGSPIVNSKGNVIAILSGGEKKELAKEFIISGAGTFYGQSASLLADLESGWSSEKSKSAEAQWQNAMIYLARRNEIWSTLEDYRKGDSLQSLGSPPVFHGKASLTSSDAKSLTAQAVETWNGVEAGTYLAFVTFDGKGTSQKPLGLRVSINGNVLQSPLYLDKAPTALFKIDANTKVSFAVDGAAGENYSLQVIRLDEPAPN